MAELKPKAPKKRNPKPNCKSGEVINEYIKHLGTPKEMAYQMLNFTQEELARESARTLANLHPNKTFADFWNEVNKELNKD